MRPLLLLTALLLTAACTSAPNPSIPETPNAPGATAPDPRCPAPTDGCMNEDNHAACLEIAATCDGPIAQLESCPLQFACEGASTPSAGDPNQSVSSDYQPCAGKACGDGCSVCPPGDADCVETAVVKVCDDAGTCSATMPTCE